MRVKTLGALGTFADVVPGNRHAFAGAMLPDSSPFAPRGGGSLIRGASSAFLGPAPYDENFAIVANVPVLTVNWPLQGPQGPVASYSELRDAVRYGWPLMFGLGFGSMGIIWALFAWWYFGKKKRARS